MNLGVFVSEERGDKILKRLKGEIAIFLVGNGVYRAVLENFKRIEAEYFCLIEDLETRGFKKNDVLPYIQPINYDELVDCVERYEKLIWL
ncbi:MAG: DsrH/TusB family sulfur metabolism protein [bacterium]